MTRGVDEWDVYVILEGTLPTTWKMTSEWEAGNHQARGRLTMRPAQIKMQFVVEALDYEEAARHATKIVREAQAGSYVPRDFDLAKMEIRWTG